MDRDFAEFAVNKARDMKVEFAEARMEKIESNEFLLKNGNMEVSEFGRFYGFNIRVLKNGCLGFASTNIMSKGKIGNIVEKAVKMANASSRLVKNKIKLSEEDGIVDSYEVKQKIKIEDIGCEEKIKKLQEFEKNIPEGILIPARIFEIADDIREKYYVNSEGSMIYSKMPKIHVLGVITIFENGETEQAILQYGKTQGWEFFHENNISEKINKEAIILQKSITEGKSAPKGEIDIIAGPEVVGIAVHESCGHPYEADRILGREAAQAGESFIKKDMIGEKIGSELVNVIEDPTIPNSYGYYLFDEEGVKARPRHMIKNGIINEFLHNRETASEMGLKSNASARASGYDKEPIIRMSNTFIEKGEYSDEELFEGINGILINSFNEWNIDDKRYNQKYVGREAYLIENGEIKYPIRKPILELTTPKFYSSIDAIGKNIEFFPGNCGKGEPMQVAPVFMGGPMIRLRNIKLGGN